MASVAGQQAQHLAGRGGRVPAPQVGHHELLDHAAHRAVVQQIQRLQRHAARALAQDARLPWPLQPAGQTRGRIEHAQFFQQRVRVQEMVAHEHGQVIADAVLVAGDDGRVRNRQPQRPAKQRHHREPVRQRAHRGRLAERPHPGPDALPAHRVVATKPPSMAASRSKAVIFMRRSCAPRVRGQGGMGNGGRAVARRVGHAVMALEGRISFAAYQACAPPAARRSRLA